MTVLAESATSFLIGAQAVLLEDDREVANSWASKHVTPNPALKWILGKYVEADRANSNKQFWSLGDLQMAQPTVDHAPLNILHRAQHIVGAFTNTEMIYPKNAEESAEENITRPYIEALAAYWKYYFPKELEIVEHAHNQGALFFSMECVSQSVTCAGEFGCGEEYAFVGPRDDSYCAHLNARSSIVQLNKPHFLAGALIVPPAAPGWKGANIKEISEIYKGQEEVLHSVYEQMKAELSHLSPSDWEEMMAALLLQAKDMPWDPKKKEDDPKKKKKSPKQVAEEVVAGMNRKKKKY